MSATSFSSDDTCGAVDFLVAPAAAAQSTAGPSSAIHLEGIAQRCLDDPPTCGMILHKFATRSADQVASLKRALDAGDALQLARGADALKGVAADLSAETLRARAEELRRTAELGALDAAALALVRTREEIDRCVEAAGRLLDEYAADA